MVTVFDCMPNHGDLQVAGKCYTAVEVGQVSLFVSALSMSIRVCTSPLRV
jgi:hypothetical protein